MKYAGSSRWRARRRRRLEDTLDLRTSELIALRKAAVEHSAASPVKSAQLALALGAWATGSAPGCRALTRLPPASLHPSGPVQPREAVAPEGIWILCHVRKFTAHCLPPPSTRKMGSSSDTAALLLPLFNQS